jgi:hypothetical protein
MHEAGLFILAGEKPEPMAERYDPRPGFRPLDYQDLGDVGEDEKGVWTAVHPLALLLAEPKLWDTVARWNAGQREMAATDYRDLSAFELRAKTAMVAALNRRLAPKKREVSDGS